MRRTNQGNERDKGLSAALKAMAVVLSVGVLAVVAGQSAYKAETGSVASPKYQMVEPAPDDAPYIAANPDGNTPPATDTLGAASLGADLQATDPQPVDRFANGAPRLLASAPANISPPEMQLQELSRPKADTPPQEDPVATF